jgi:hypothetical protein
MEGVMGVALTEQGISIRHDNCGNHVHSDVWDVVPYAQVRGALKTGSPFEPAWSK